MKEEYKEAYLCSLKIKQFIEKKYYFYLMMMRFYILQYILQSL
nr:hypothetical protein [Clostridium botulinum]